MAQEQQPGPAEAAGPRGRCTVEHQGTVTTVSRITEAECRALAATLGGEAGWEPVPDAEFTALDASEAQPRGLCTVQHDGSTSQFFCRTRSECSRIAKELGGTDEWEPDPSCG